MAAKIEQFFFFQSIYFPHKIFRCGAYDAIFNYNSGQQSKNRVHRYRTSCSKALQVANKMSEFILDKTSSHSWIACVV